MPKAVTINEVVSLDLKEVRSEKKHILYCVDEFSAFIVAEVINNRSLKLFFKLLTKDGWSKVLGFPRKGSLVIIYFREEYKSVIRLNQMLACVHFPPVHTSTSYQGS